MDSNLVVGAIDFGTTYSGWAILFKHEFESEPTKGFVRQWHSETSTTEKAPTVVLVRPDGKTLEAFGYEAEDKYKDLAEKDEHKDYFYFRRFKMMLNKKLGETIDHNTQLEDEMGRSLPALDVFAMAIRFLVEDMHNEVKKRIVGGVEKDEVHWVITVPAIWTDDAKKFMRKAGTMAGIGEKQLSIALEPEAASIFCRYLPVSRRVDVTGVDVSSFPAGTKYLVLDAGGGTVDITVHEVDQFGSVKEVIPASGGGWGGTLVDKAFEDLLVAIVGRNVYSLFKKEETEEWIDLWRDFERKKKTVRPEKDSKIAINLPVSLSNIFGEEHRGESIVEALGRSVYSGNIEYEFGKLKFEASVFKQLFDESLKYTSLHVGTLHRRSEVKDVKAILMVGGFSESAMLQNEIRKSFKNVDVIIPADAASSILRGAMIFGHSPKAITERVLKYTYGVSSTDPFIPGKHSERKKIQTDKGVRCNDIFSKHAEQGQIVKVGEPQAKKSYIPIYESQTALRFSIYASESKTPTYIDDPGCTKIDEFRVEIPDHDGNMDRNVLVSFTFSGTEINVEAEDEKTGKKTKVTTKFQG